jgi:hypothetical protein
MKIETLKELIEREYKNTSSVETLKIRVLELLDLYEKDNKLPNLTSGTSTYIGPSSAGGRIGLTYTNSPILGTS